MVGYSDEILDVAYLGYNDSHIALATNSCDIKLYEITSMDCQLLCGHTDSVLALATTPANVNLLMSSAKVFIFFNICIMIFTKLRYYASFRSFNRKTKIWPIFKG